MFRLGRHSEDNIHKLQYGEPRPLSCTQKTTKIARNVVDLDDSDGSFQETNGAFNFLNRRGDFTSSLSYKKALIARHYEKECRKRQSLDHPNSHPSM